MSEIEKIVTMSKVGMVLGFLVSSWAFFSLMGSVLVLLSLRKERQV